MWLINWWRERKRQESRRESMKVAAAIAYGLCSSDKKTDPAICAMLKTMAETGYCPPEISEREPDPEPATIAALR